MTGNDSINYGLKNIWKSWFNFKKGKHMTAELHAFQFYLEKNLFELQRDLGNGGYRHGTYRKFVVCDNKRREISVAGIRDRVVHRLIYDFLVPLYDKTFVFDAWSCRVGKGLLGAIERAQEFLRKSPHAYVWRADIKKFFESFKKQIDSELNIYLDDKIREAERQDFFIPHHFTPPKGLTSDTRIAKKIIYLQ
jgi:RNA-directed DNA polymerase